MKRVAYGVTLPIGLLLVLSGIALAQGGMMGRGGMGGGMGMMGPHMLEDEEEMEEMMGPGMMPQMMRGMMGGGRRGMAARMGMHQPSQLVDRLKAELGLSDEQAKRLKELFLAATKTAVQQRADWRIAEIELRELLAADQVDMAQVENTLKAIEGLRAALRLNLIRTHEQAKDVLTPEQRDKLAQLHEHMPGMMGMMEMMGQPRGGMMGPGMQRGMGPEGRPMMPMQGMMHQMGGMMQELAMQVQAGQMTPEQMQRLGEVMGDMAEMMRGMSEVMGGGMRGGMAPGAGRQEMMGQMSQMMQRMTDMQQRLSEMSGAPQPQRR